MPYARVTHNQRPAYHDIVIYQGATFTDTVTVKNTDGTPFDLTGYTASGTIKKVEASDSDVSITATITDAANGIITMSLTNAETAALTTINNAQTWTVYDLEISLVSLTTTVYRILQGQVLIEPELTT